MKRVVLALSALALATAVACGGSKEAKKEDKPVEAAPAAAADAGAAPAADADGGAAPAAAPQ
ncbi:MAG: hypothetical protein AB2A00_10605 [Myxococcota bacterium]